MSKLTQKAILKTFDDMIREMPFEKITITALVARCEISSNTFYYHYQDIYDLLDQWLDMKLSKYQEDITLKGDWKSVLKKMLHNYQANPNIVNHVFRSIPRERMENFLFHILENDIFSLMKQQAKDLQLSEEALRTFAGVFYYSLCGFILKFIYEDMTADIDETFDPVIDFLDISFINYAKLNAARNFEP